MVNNSQIENIVAVFPQFAKDKRLLEQIHIHAIHMQIPAGKTVCDENQSAQALPLLMSGSIRILKLGETGREISLYHVVSGESCVLTASSILSTKPFPALAEVERDSEVFLIPEAKVCPWLIEYPTWRQFIFDLFAQRLGEVISIIEEVAFQRVDRRIANRLLTLPRDENGKVDITHQAIATEIGTAREVVTRVLRDLNSKNIVKLARGSINIVDEPRLRQLKLD